jgi:O-antigen/teichoic acid export membrane protein
MLRVMVVIFAAACAYAAALMVSRQWIVKTLYGPGYYSGFLWLLPWLCVGSIAASLIQGLTIWLKAFEKPNASFWSQAAGAAMTVSIGLYLVWQFKLVGAAIAMILVNLAAAVVLLSFVRRFLRGTQ